MTVPQYADFYLPTLKGFEDGEIHTKREIKEFNANFLNLSEEDKRERTRGGSNFIYHSHSDHAIDDLFHAGLLVRLEEGRGNYQISDEGINVLEQNLESITRAFLSQYEGFRAYKGLNNVEEGEEIPDEITEIRNNLAPQELIDIGYNEINNELSSQLLEKILENTPDSFERLVVDLLIAIGYGGSKKEAGQAVGGTGDGGIDGIIKEDYLGLDNIYIQAKRYAAHVTVGDPEIMRFIGALDKKRASKGVFITTSDFSIPAKNTANTSRKHIKLINGRELTELMIKFNVGVSLIDTYEIKEIDNDYFDDI